MIKKLKDLENMIKDTRKEVTISKDLYDLLIHEKENIDTLIRAVENQRSNAILRVIVSGELLSEQIGRDIPLPEKGLSKRMIQAIREYRYAKNHGEDYEGIITENEITKTIKGIRRILNKGADGPQRLDAFERRPKGSVVVYRIEEECYENELFQYMGCINNNTDEVINFFGKMTMNVIQIDYLCKNKKIIREAECRDENKNDYRILVMIDGKIEMFQVYLRGDSSFGWGPTSKIKKGAKLLLFVPSDIQDEEREEWSGF